MSLKDFDDHLFFYLQPTIFLQMDGVTDPLA